MATLYTTDGEAKTVVPANGTTFTLNELQGFVGGYIELVRVTDGYLVVNEEGKLRGLPPNMKATEIYRFGAEWVHDVIAGPALLVSGTEVE